MLIAVFSVRVDYFVMFMALYIPFEEFVLKWLPQSVYSPARYSGEALLIAVFLVVLFNSFINTSRFWKSTPIDLPVALLLVVIVLSAAVNDVPAEIAALGMKNLLRYILLFYIAANSGLPERFWKRLVYALMAVAVLEGLLGMAQYAFKGPFIELFQPSDVMLGDVTVREADLAVGKSFGTLGRYNFLGNFLNIVMCFGMGLYYAGGEKNKTGFGLFFAVTLAGLVASFSRMSWVGIYLVFLFILLIQKKKRAIIYILVPVVLTASMAVAYEGTHWFRGETGKASPVERYVSVFSEGYIQKAMKYDRLFALFVTAPTVIEKYPLLGLGPGTFASEVTGGGTHERGLYPEHSHKDWLGIRKAEALKYTSDQGWTAILCQLGLGGLMCFLWIFWRIYRYALQAYKDAAEPFSKGVALGFLGVFFLVVFQNFVSFNLTYRSASLYFWLFAGYMVALNAAPPKHEGKPAVK